MSWPGRAQAQAPAGGSGRTTRGGGESSQKLSLSSKSVVAVPIAVAIAVAIVARRCCCHRRRCRCCRCPHRCRRYRRAVIVVVILLEHAGHSGVLAQPGGGCRRLGGHAERIRTSQVLPNSMTTTMLICSTRNGVIVFKPPESDDCGSGAQRPGGARAASVRLTGAIDVGSLMQSSQRTSAAAAGRSHDAAITRIARLLPRRHVRTVNARDTRQGGTASSAAPAQRTCDQTLRALGAHGDRVASGALVQDVEPHLRDRGRGEVGRRVGGLLGGLRATGWRWCPAGRA